MSRDEGSVQDLAPVGERRNGDFAAQPEKYLSARIDDAPPPLKPLSAGELLDLGLELLRYRFALIAGTCVLLWIPVRVLEPFIGSSAWIEKQDSLGETATVLLTFAGLALTGFLQILVQALASALVARLLEDMRPAT